MSRTVLVVEDDALIAMDLQVELARLGYTTCAIARDADTAFRTAERLQPEIAMIDLVLEDGKTGLKLGQILRKQFGTRIIFMTGFRQAVAAYYMDGVAGVLSKPIATDDLRAMLTRAFSPVA